MTIAAVVLTHGFEEIEAVTIIDVLRRAGVTVQVAALDGDAVLGAHQIRMEVDTGIAQLDPGALDAVILPGGDANAQALRDDSRVRNLLSSMASANKLVAAICAAPIALEAAGLLGGVRATSYPGYDLPSAEYLTERVVEDGRIITSRAAGTALEFSLALVRRLVSHEKATEIRQKMLVRI